VASDEPVPYDDVLEDLIESMAKMGLPIRIRGPVVQHKVTHHTFISSNSGSGILSSSDIDRG